MAGGHVECHVCVQVTRLVAAGTQAAKKAQQAAADAAARTVLAGEVARAPALA